ncbi:similar to Saccharomyces cerevisiae YIL149C MLP2 Myosin-like protein associated with the nuclear envelope, connects the nuclear pore complex with the nuclear interior [Maudiozyma saulgeensis]|uniref:Similar to Saccharomyces cerevisiae YIL149C MLP2 Myosin-like protein associated with the nuclear envelope, connects the nuclear pore complex with the nuclear interior n=1 Tax=Maudiozyma saulgeensis TaxID=1789683 RepID=A0A1X7R9J1_9SACH|nr:similar to Saccharomyces cerevisiae YIL149C MLP2 Myosin-like protein associated with the nuclear envelope, connects the nuclear pore complex with the nuclear interior [Kazachstania saulgeensis]
MSEDGNRTNNMDLKGISTFFHIPVTQLSTFDENTLVILQKKLQEFNDLQNSNIELNSKIGKIRADSEKENDIQLVMEQLAKENEIFKRENIDIKSQVNNNEQKVEIDKLNAHIKDQEQTKTDLVKLLNEKINEIVRMESQITSTLETNKEQNQRYQRIIDELGETQSENLSLHAELEKTKHLLGDSDRKKNSLIAQLENKSHQFSDYRTSKENIISKSVNDLLSCKNELKDIKDKHSSLVEKYDRLDKEGQENSNLIDDLKFTVKLNKEEYCHETDSQKELISVLEGQVKNFQEKLKAQFGREELSSQNTKKGFDELSQELSTLKKRLEYSEQERAHLEAYVNQLMLNEQNDDSEGNEDNSIKLQSDITILREELKHERYIKERLEQQIEIFISDLQTKVPAINSFKDKTASLENELTNISLLLEHTSNDNETNLKAIHEKDKQITELNDSVTHLRSQRKHLANQVKYLLVNMEICGNGNYPMTAEEGVYLKSILDDEENAPVYNNDTSLVIAENAEKFKNILELQQQNMKLLSTVDQLSSRAEYLETLNSKMESNSEGEIIQDAKEAILTLEARNNYLERKLKIFENNTPGHGDLKVDNPLSHSDKNIGENNKTDQMHLKTISDLQKTLQTTIDTTLKTKTSLQNKLKEITTKLSTSTLEYEKEKSKNELMNQKLMVIQNSMDLLKTDNKQLTLRNSHLEENLGNKEKRMNKTLKEFVECKSELTTLNVILKSNEVEKESAFKDRDHFKDKLSNSNQERNSLKIDLSKAQATLKENEILWSVKDTTYKETILNLEESLSESRKRLSVKDDELRELLANRYKETEWYKVKIETSNIEINMLKNSIEERSAKIEQLLSDLKVLENEIVDKNVAINSYKRIINDGQKSPAQEKLEAQLNEVQQSLNKTLVESKKYKIEVSEIQTSLQNMTTLYEDEKKTVKDLEIVLENTTKELNQNKEDLQKNIDELKLELINQKTQLGEKEAEFQSKLSEIELTKIANKENYESKILNLAEELEQQKIINDEIQQKYYTSLNEHSSSENSKQNDNVSKEFPDIKMEVDPKQMESLQELNNILQEKMEKAETKCDILTEQIIVSQTEISNLKTQLNNINEENEGLKASSIESVKAVHAGDVNEINDQHTEMGDLLKKNEELEDRFNRLKKQAHERLHSSKLASEALSSQMDTLKQENIQLVSKLEDEMARASSLEQMVSDFDNRSNVVIELQKELEYAKIHSREIEYKLNDTMEKSNGLIEKLNVEINNLKSELEEAKTTELGTIVSNDDSDDYGKVIENMRKTFEDEKIQFIKDQTEEFEKKLKDQGEKLQLELEDNMRENVRTVQETIVDVNALKKKWEEDNESAVLQRIQEATEKIKEEVSESSKNEINKSIVDHKNELDQEFDKKVEAKAKELLETPVFGKIKEQIQSEIETKLESAHTEDLQEVKRKSFEEGQQQVSMKLTFLQKKISSLESQLSNAKQDDDQDVSEGGNETVVTVDNDKAKYSEAETSFKSEKELDISLRAQTPSPFKANNSPFAPGSSIFLKGANLTSVDATKNPFSASFDLTGSSPSGINPFSKFQPTFSFGKQETQNDIEESSQNSTPGNKRAFEEEEDDEDEDDNTSNSTDSKKSKND